MSPGEPSPDPEVAGGAGILIVGPGRVGLSLAAALSDAGHPVTVHGRSAETPGFLAGRDGVRYASDRPSPSDAARPSTLVFTVPDDELAEIAARWAVEAPDPVGGSGSSPAAVALHTSGVHASDALAPLREGGWSVAAWHPLTALAAPRTDAFRDIAFAVEGDDRATERARGLTRTMGGRALEVEPGAHARYHASAVFASNYLVACLAVAARELDGATRGDAGLPDLLPLATAALDNLREGGLSAGATGPLSRGDVGTVRRHLEALPEESAELYRRLARELLQVVEGRLAPAAARELRTALGPGGERGASGRA